MKSKNTVFIQTLVTPRVHKKLVAKAKANGMSLATYMRWVLLREVDKVVVTW